MSQRNKVLAAVVPCDVDGDERLLGHLHHAATGELLKGWDKILNADEVVLRRYVLTKLGLSLFDISELRSPLKAQLEAGGPVLTKTSSTQTTKRPKMGMLCLPSQGHAVKVWRVNNLEPSDVTVPLHELTSLLPQKSRVLNWSWGCEPGACRTAISPK